MELNKRIVLFLQWKRFHKHASSSYFKARKIVTLTFLNIFIILKNVSYDIRFCAIKFKQVELYTFDQMLVRTKRDKPYNSKKVKTVNLINILLTKC